MKFRIVENVVNESSNTNLRKFLLSVAEYSDLDIVSLVGAISVNDIVVHHTKKDRSLNGIDDLVLMSDHQHRSMHSSYRFKKWNENAHLEYDFVPVRDVLAAVSKNLAQQSTEDELLLTK